MPPACRKGRLSAKGKSDPAVRATMSRAGINQGQQMAQQPRCESGAKLHAETGFLFEVCVHLNLSKRRCIGL